MTSPPDMEARRLQRAQNKLLREKRRAERAARLAQEAEPAQEPALAEAPAREAPVAGSATGAAQAARPQAGGRNGGEPGKSNYETATADADERARGDRKHRDLALRPESQGAVSLVPAEPAASRDEGAGKERTPEERERARRRRRERVQAREQRALARQQEAAGKTPGIEVKDRPEHGPAFPGVPPTAAPVVPAKPRAAAAKAPPSGIPASPAPEPAPAAPPAPSYPQGLLADLLDRRETSVRRAGLISFFLVVVFPTFLAAIYFAFIATPRYVSEVRFVVRGTVEMLGGESTRFSGDVSALSALTNNQETHIIAEHIASRGMVQLLLSRYDLFAIYRLPRTDAAGNEAGAALDALVATWQRMVHIEVDAISGVVDVQVQTYAPDDAPMLAAAVITESERLADDLTARTREDRAARTAREVQVSREILTEALIDFQAFRNKQGTLDANNSAAALEGFVSLLRDQRVTLQSELSTARNTSGELSPSAQTLTSRLASLDDEIRNFESQIDGRKTASSRASVPSSLVSQEGLETRRSIAIARVSRAEAAESIALADASRQQVFLLVFEGPTRPQIATAPVFFRDTGIAFLAFFAFWVLGAAYAANLREHA